jgi:nicotinamide riboside transporter PnuC
MDSTYIYWWLFLGLIVAGIYTYVSRGGQVLGRLFVALFIAMVPVVGVAALIVLTSRNSKKWQPN